MHATTATFFGRPRSTRLLSCWLMTGFQRVADSVAIYRAFRTLVRPPAMVRLPRICPESRLIGATPTSAAMRRRSFWESSV